MSASATAKSANKPKTDKPKRKAPSTAWKPGQSGNPKGAPKRGESWQEIIKRYGELTPPEAAELSLELTKKLLSIGDGVTLKQAVVLRVYADLLYEPNPGLLNSFMERAEGKVSQPIEVTWRDEAKAAGLPPEEIDAMAEELFKKAMADAGDIPA